MKKIFATLACILLATSFSFATDDSKWSAGVKAAFDYGRMYGFEDPDDNMSGSPAGIGFDAGIMLRMGLVKGVYFVPEVNFAYISTSHKVLKKERSYTSMDLEIPLMLRAVFFDKFYATAGVQVVLNLMNDSDIPPMADKSTFGGAIINAAAGALGLEERTEQGFFNIGLAAGLGYNIVGGLNIDAKFYMGFMELFPDVTTPGDDDLGDPYTFISMHGAKMMKFSLGVSYWIL